MYDNLSIAMVRQVDNNRRALRGIFVGIAFFMLLGTVAAVWENPIVLRMTSVGPWEFVATALTAVLAGLTASFWVPACGLRTSGTGGVTSFLGIACPTCNKILMLIFGGPALIAWFDPLRPWLTAAGLIVMTIAAVRTWRSFRIFRQNDTAGPRVQNNQSRRI